jgi:hypothetical protein
LFLLLQRASGQHGAASRAARHCKTRRAGRSTTTRVRQQPAAKRRFTALIDSIDNERRSPLLCRDAVGGVSVIGNGEAHAGSERECSPVAQFDVNRSSQDEERVPAVAPVIRDITGAIFDHAHAQVAPLAHSRNAPAGRAAFERRRNGRKVNGGECDGRKFHSSIRQAGVRCRY